MDFILPDDIPLAALEQLDAGSSVGFLRAILGDQYDAFADQRPMRSDVMAVIDNFRELYPVPEA